MLALHVADNLTRLLLLQHAACCCSHGQAPGSLACVSYYHVYNYNSAS